MVFQLLPVSWRPRLTLSGFPVPFSSNLLPSFSAPFSLPFSTLSHDDRVYSALHSAWDVDLL
eukprot:4370251-Heterocapsa_arctica.AAC.1